MNTTLLPFATELEQHLDSNDAVVRSLAIQRSKAAVTKHILDDKEINHLIEYMPQHHLPVSNTIYVIQKHRHGYPYVTDIISPITDLDTINLIKS